MQPIKPINYTYDNGKLSPVEKQQLAIENKQGGHPKSLKALVIIDVLLLIAGGGGIAAALGAFSAWIAIPFIVAVATTASAGALLIILLIITVFGYCKGWFSKTVHAPQQDSFTFSDVLNVIGTKKIRITTTTSSIQQDPLKHLQKLTDQYHQVVKSINENKTTTHTVQLEVILSDSEGVGAGIMRIYISKLIEALRHVQINDKPLFKQDDKENSTFIEPAWTHDDDKKLSADDKAVKNIYENFGVLMAAAFYSRMYKPNLYLNVGNNVSYKDKIIIATSASEAKPVDFSFTLGLLFDENIFEAIHSLNVLNLEKSVLDEKPVLDNNIHLQKVLCSKTDFRYKVLTGLGKKGANKLTQKDKENIEIFLKYIREEKKDKNELTQEDKKSIETFLKYIREEKREAQWGKFREDIFQLITPHSATLPVKAFARGIQSIQKPLDAIKCKNLNLLDDSFNAAEIMAFHCSNQIRHKIQGTLDRGAVKKAITVVNNKKLSKKKVLVFNTFCQWINDFVDEKDQHETFVKGATGSLGLAPNTEIKLIPIDNSNKIIKINTCVKEIQLPTEWPASWKKIDEDCERKKAFFEILNAALDASLDG